MEKHHHDDVAFVGLTVKAQKSKNRKMFLTSGEQAL